jgi:hypothetical protein
MLITERTSDGRTVVRLHKDWHPARLGSNYQPRPRNYMDDNYEALHIQDVLLRSHYDASNIRCTTKAFPNLKFLGV